MKRHQYFTHFSNSCLYRFPVNNTTNGECFGDAKRWYGGGVTGGKVKRLILSNWTKISRDEARKKFPRAFRPIV